MINEPVASLWPAETWKTFYLSFVSGFKHTQLRFVTKNNFALVHLRHLSLRKEIAACVITAFTQEQITTHRSIFLSGIFEDAALAVLCLKEGFSVPNQKHKPISWFIFERFSESRILKRDLREVGVTLVTSQRDSFSAVDIQHTFPCERWIKNQKFHDTILFRSSGLYLFFFYPVVFSPFMLVQFTTNHYLWNGCKL